MAASDNSHLSNSPITPVKTQKRRFTKQIDRIQESNSCGSTLSPRGAAGVIAEAVSVAQGIEADIANERKHKIWQTAAEKEKTQIISLTPAQYAKEKFSL